MTLSVSELTKGPKTHLIHNTWLEKEGSISPPCAGRNSKWRKEDYLVFIFLFHSSPNFLYSSNFFHIPSSSSSPRTHFLVFSLEISAHHWWFQLLSQGQIWQRIGDSSWHSTRMMACFKTYENIVLMVLEVGYVLSNTQT